MTVIFRNTATYAWIFLIFLTAFSWWLSLDLTVGVDNAYKFTTMGLFLLAFFKVRLVIMHFMELRTAPLPLRAVFEAWVIIVCAVLVGLYWFA